MQIQWNFVVASSTEMTIFSDIQNQKLYTHERTQHLKRQTVIILIKIHFPQYLKMFNLK